jgi:hypothetical protein
MDAKHTLLQPAFNKESEFYNYRLSFNILFPLAGMQIIIFCVDVGCQGRILDGGVFSNCELNVKMGKDSITGIVKLKS